VSSNVPGSVHQVFESPDTLPKTMSIERRRKQQHATHPGTSVAKLGDKLVFLWDDDCDDGLGWHAVEEIQAPMVVERDGFVVATSTKWQNEVLWDF
jgi:hypothetical protein